MKNQKTIQLVTAIFALTLLTTYVLQSQRHAAQAQGGTSPQSTVAGRITPEAPSGAGTAPEPPVQARQIGKRPEAVAPGSKSMAPVMAVRPPSPFLPSNHVQVTRPGSVVLPGSKSAPVFTIQPKPRN